MRSSLALAATAAALLAPAASAQAWNVTANQDGLGIATFTAYPGEVNATKLELVQGIALRFRSIQAAPMMQTPTFLILFLSPVYVPLDLLQGWIKTVAEFNPITALLDAGRGFISGVPNDPALAFALGAGLIALFVLWALRGLRQAETAV